MASIRARIYRQLLRLLFLSIDADTDIPVARAKFEQIARRMPMRRGTTLQRGVIGAVDCEWVIPEDAGEDAPLLLYLHGGAYVCGSSATHRAMLSHLAAFAGMRALIPNYRLAPEHPFPAGLHDCQAVYRALLGAGYDAGSMAVAGDSAGGGMSLALLVSMRDEGTPLPAAAVLFSPWLDLTGSGPTMESRATVDPMFRADDMPTVAAYYAPEERLRDPLISPLFADVHDLPPMLIQVGDQEILLSDSTRLCDKMSAAGGKVTLQVWPELWHVFQYAVGRVPEAKRALADAGNFLAKLTGEQQRTGSIRAA